MSRAGSKGGRKKIPHVISWDLIPIRVGGRKGWRLLQKPFGRRASSRKEADAEAIQLTGWRADVVLPILVDGVRSSGEEPATISSHARVYRLSEADGYRLALAFWLSKRTDSVRQVERMVRALRQFEEEEAYLWYSYMLRAGRNGGEARLATALANLGEAIG